MKFIIEGNKRICTADAVMQTFDLWQFFSMRDISYMLCTRGGLYGNYKMNKLTLDFIE